MGIRYECFKKKSLCLVVWEGTHVPAEEWFDHLRRMGGDPEVISSHLHLADLRFVTVHPSFGDRELKEGADFVAGVPGLLTGRKVAVVAIEEFSKSRAFERLLKPYAANIIVFHALDVACAWLGLNPGEIGNEEAQLLERLRNRRA